MRRPTEFICDIYIYKWAEGVLHEGVAQRGEQVAAVRGVDVKEDTGDDDALVLEKLLEEHLQSEFSVSTAWMQGHNTPSRCQAVTGGVAG